MDLRDLIRAAEAQGWVVTKTTKGHWRFIPPDPAARICIFSGTPSDHRAIRNFLALVERTGFVNPWRPKKEGDS